MILDDEVKQMLPFTEATERLAEHGLLDVAEDGCQCLVAGIAEQERRLVARHQIALQLRDRTDGVIERTRRTTRRLLGSIHCPGIDCLHSDVLKVPNIARYHRHAPGTGERGDLTVSRRDSCGTTRNCNVRILARYHDASP